MSDVVERAKAALEALGDKGPWTIDSEDGEPIIHEAHHYDSTDEWYDVDGANGGWVAHCEDLPVAEFIAQARSLVPELIAEVERKSAQLAEWRAQYDAIDAENERLRAALGDAWDDGNATGLDGWIGPGIGDSRGVDDQAVYNRNRFLDAALGKGASHGPLYPYKILAALDTEGEA
ncbi:hypothetical protein PBI_HARLEY_91 [Mycobacterium phage Harley]|uniref:Uncharacterized protein n=1 Tax=Mycobacterium phage Harley TaxID=2282909 RepID=A0A346FC26_9CAUD|nr:hypothetical protein I5H45_gp091 [Mycobacterium phage Harley]AXN53251.1 hypothetical protein PBI_HARLEY_91 [Mycobacterium phage Harley]